MIQHRITLDGRTLSTITLGTLARPLTYKGAGRNSVPQLSFWSSRMRATTRYVLLVQSAGADPRNPRVGVVELIDLDGDVLDFDPRGLDRDSFTPAESAPADVLAAVAKLAEGAGATAEPMAGAADAMAGAAS